MEPHDRTSDVEQPAMQAITLTQIDRGHAGAASAVVALVVEWDDLAPRVSDLLVTVLAETDVDEEVAVFLVGPEIGRGNFAGPLIDRSRARGHAIPASQTSCSLGFVV